MPPSGTSDTTIDHKNLVSSTATEAVEEKKMVLLQTAQAKAGNELTQKEIQVRVLFDSGSQRSYITEYLCCRLKLNPIRAEKLRLNTFGDTRFKPRQCKLYKLYLCNTQSSEKIEITALSFPVIYSTLPVISNVKGYLYAGKKDTEAGETKLNQKQKVVVVEEPRLMTLCTSPLDSDAENEINAWEYLLIVYQH